MSTLPHARGSETSQAAADSMASRAAKQEGEVLHAIAQRGATGATCDEIEVELQLSHQSASARVTGLKKSGIIVDSGEKRKTRSGRDAVVWMCPPYSHTA